MTPHPGLSAAGVDLGAAVDVGAGIEVEADLTIGVDTGPRGRATAQISGAGRELRVHIDRPEIVLAGAGRRAATELAGVLDAGGVQVELHGRGRRIAVLDPGRVDRVGALLGSPRLHLDPAAWSVLARAAAPAPSWPRALLAGGVAITAALAIRSHRRRGRGRGRGRGR